MEAFKQIGIDPQLLQKIMALYSNPKATVCINGILSDPIEISNGTGQGCLLSPLLYVIEMEHLTTAIRNNLDIQGIRVKGKEDKMSVYADDLLIYVTNPVVTLPNHIQEFKCFGAVSNFKVNSDKSDALNTSLPTKFQQLLQKNVF